MVEHSSGSAQLRSAFIEGWSVYPTREECSVRLRRLDDQELVIIAGRQIVTAERLEVLAIGTKERFADGTALVEVVRTIKRHQSIPVIPWGTGKWMGNRGRLVEKLLKGPEAAGLFLGDNGNRPSFWPRPALFKFAQAEGIRILPGSDPLPFASEQKRAGSFGCFIDGTISPDYPARDLSRILSDGTGAFQPYGRLERSRRFVLNQVAMQLRRRGRRQQ
jgi:hypothetical protein